MHFSSESPLYWRSSVFEKTEVESVMDNIKTPELTDEQIVQVLTNVAPEHPALARVHQKLNKSYGAEAAITSYDRMHHRHNR
jgi:hypothetical protein